MHTIPNDLDNHYKIVDMVTLSRQSSENRTNNGYKQGVFNTKWKKKLAKLRKNSARQKERHTYRVCANVNLNATIYSIRYVQKLIKSLIVPIECNQIV